jgi:type II secretion system protein L
MTTLRVLFAHPPSPEREVDWALFDDGGACTASGRDLPDELPRAERYEAVVAASQARIATVALPPMATSRLASAARFALEDQLAGPPEALHLAVSAQQPNGSIRAAIVDRTLLQTIANAGGMLARPLRIVAEPDLAPKAQGWRWCGNEDRDGFVRCPDGSAFPVDALRSDGLLPSELVLALAQAKRGGTTPSQVHVDAPFPESLLARWQRETGVAFRVGKPWQWHAAAPAAYSAALDLMPGAGPPVPATPRPDPARMFVPALWIAVAALALHLLATAGEWAWLKLDAWSNAREWTALAVGAGIAPESADTPAAARAALGRRYAELRHAQGLPAPDDALPLLARAAPALAALPQGTVKNASYADGHWTLELTRADAAMLDDLDARLRQAGVPALMAVAGTSARVRLSAP